MELKRREGESAGSFLHRFTKKIRQSGVLVEMKKRRFRKRKPSKLKKRLSALYRNDKREEMEKAKKWGLV